MDIWKGMGIGMNIKVHPKRDSDVQPVHNSDNGTPNAKHVLF